MKSTGKLQQLLNTVHMRHTLVQLGNTSAEVIYDDLYLKSDKNIQAPQVIFGGGFLFVYVAVFLLVCVGFFLLV